MQRFAHWRPEGPETAVCIPLYFIYLLNLTFRQFNSTRQHSSQSLKDIFLISFSLPLCACVFDLCGSAGHWDTKLASQYSAA